MWSRRAQFCDSGDPLPRRGRTFSQFSHPYSCTVWCAISHRVLRITICLASRSYRCRLSRCKQRQEHSPVQNANTWNYQHVKIPKRWRSFVFCFIVFDLSNLKHAAQMIPTCRNIEAQRNWRAKHFPEGQVRMWAGRYRIQVPRETFEPNGCVHQEGVESGETLEASVPRRFNRKVSNPNSHRNDQVEFKGFASTADPRQIIERKCARCHLGKARCWSCLLLLNLIRILEYFQTSTVSESI